MKKLLMICCALAGCLFVETNVSAQTYYGTTEIDNVRPTFHVISCPPRSWNVCQIWSASGANRHVKVILPNGGFIVFSVTIIEDTPPDDPTNPITIIIDPSTGDKYLATEVITP